MKVILLSFFLNSETPSYGGIKNAVQLTKVKSIEKGDNSNNSEICIPSHIGTHIDLPYHFDSNAKNLNDYPPEFWIFKNVGFIEGSVENLCELIKNLPENIELLILKTGFGCKRKEETYWKDQPVINAEFASLFKKNFPLLRAFGFDLISLTSKRNREEGKRAHIEFLINNEILIIEDMNLDLLLKTPSQVIIAPILINNADGAPCTIFAIN